MDLTDWLLTFHLLSAAVVAMALVALWAIVFATRTASPVITMDQAMRIGNIAGPMVGAGMGVALVFGVWLSFQIDDYHVWDAWIVASLLLWLLAGYSGTKSGRIFVAGGSRSAAVKLQLVNTFAVLAILALMIWKPGA